MNKVDAIEIQPGQQVSLKPDSYHIMLTGLTGPLTEGSTFDITLDFENAPDVTLPVTVTAPTAAAPMDTMDHSKMMAPADTTTTTPTMDESPAPADAVTPTDEPTAMTPDTTTPTPDMAPTSSAPDASTTTPSADEPAAQ